jgi:G protein-coupled receptor Mth (Methuselah protein)
MIVSIPFLVTTFFVYACIRELRNLHGKSLMSYIFSLTVMYAILALFGLFDRYLVENYNRTCKVLGYTLLTSMFMCFFWLNCMCFDIFTTFKG